MRVSKVVFSLLLSEVRASGKKSSALVEKAHSFMIQAVEVRRRRDFGRFLRQRRSRLQPAELGLPDGGRRHVRGLRRSEVAEIAEIGVTWYSMLEQGRVDNVSPRTLDAIAKALRFDRAEREHLGELAASAFVPPHADLSPPPEMLLDFVRRIDFAMAFIVSPRFDVVAFNDRADTFFAFSRHGATPNLLRLMLADPAMRRRFVDPTYDAVLTQMIGHFRLMYGRYGGAAFADLIDELGDHADFARLWESCALKPPPSERSRLRFADDIERDVAVMAFTSFSAPAYTMIFKVTTEAAPDDCDGTGTRDGCVDAAERATSSKRSIEFGAFLRSKRESIRPQDVGLASVGRRHARGLRRDEVAERAGIGVSRYTMLEQGRIGTVPDGTLRAVADALLLTARERTYLARLAASASARFAAEDPAPNRDLVAFVRSYQLGLAHFHDADFNMVAWNDVAGRFYGYAERERPNLLEIMADRASLRTGFVSPSWEATLRQMLAHYRFTHASLIAEDRDDLLPWIAARSPDFARVYAQDPGVANPPIAAARFELPSLGPRDTNVFLLTPAACPSHVIVLKNFADP
jgi:transcriptional regulator with XRE-family HTH domain